VNFRHLDLNLLRVFDAMLADRNTTRAGERLGLSQPAVSSALNRLREMVGDRLFVREGAQMVPTAKALVLADPVHEALARVERAFSTVAAFDPATAERTFRIYGSDFFAEFLMPGLAARVGASAPGIVLQLIDNSLGQMQARLADRVVDLAIDPTRDVPDWLSHRPVLRSGLRVAAAADHPALAEAEVVAGAPLPLDLFCALPQALCSQDGRTAGVVDRELERLGRRRRVALTLPQFHSVAVAIASGRLIGALPTAPAEVWAPQLGLTLYELPFASPEVELSMYWHRRHDQDEAHGWLRDQVIAALPGNGSG
jgi:DNA-binding transcriptional LysR family regulator